MMIDIWRNVLFDWKFPYYFCILVFHMIHKHMKLCKKLYHLGPKSRPFELRGKRKVIVNIPWFGEKHGILPICFLGPSKIHIVKNDSKFMNLKIIFLNFIWSQKWHQNHIFEFHLKNEDSQSHWEFPMK